MSQRPRQRYRLFTSLFIYSPTALVLIMGLALTTSTPSLAVAVLVFTGHSVSTSRMSVILSPVRTEAPALMAWVPTAAPAL